MTKTRTKKITHFPDCYIGMYEGKVQDVRHLENPEKYMFDPKYIKLTIGENERYAVQLNIYHSIIQNQQ